MDLLRYVPDFLSPESSKEEAVQSGMSVFNSGYLISGVLIVYEGYRVIWGNSLDPWNILVILIALWSGTFAGVKALERKQSI